MELTVKAHIHAAVDPNFFLMYLRDDGDDGDGNNNHDDNDVNATATRHVTTAASASTDGNDAIKSCAIVNVGRDQGGMPLSPWLYFLLFVYCLPNIFRWGLTGFFNCLKAAYTEIYRAYVYAEMADHLGVKMADCYQLEYLATDIRAVGKGYGSILIKVIYRYQRAHEQLPTCSF